MRDAGEQRGGVSYFFRGGHIFESEGGAEHRVVGAASIPAAIPATMDGVADFRIANAMAAIAAARACGPARDREGVRRGRKF
jgi:cyanophycin synthetase